MTGNIGFSTTVVLAAIIDRGSQSLSFRSRMSALGGGSPARAGPAARQVNDASRVRAFMGVGSAGEGPRECTGPRRRTPRGDGQSGRTGDVSRRVGRDNPAT